MSDILNKIMLDDIVLPGMPEIALQVIAALEDEYCSIQKLENIIYQDPALTATILKVGNAPLYRTGKSAATLAETIMTIGLSNLVAFVCVASLTNHVLGKEVDKVLLRHMIAVSAAAGQLSEKLKGVRIRKEYAVVAGLLHDIGKLILFDLYPVQYKKVRNTVIGDERAFFEVEDAMLGVNHSSVGAILAEKWNFPAPYQAAIRMHHEPVIEEHPRGMETHLGYLVRVADKMVIDAGIGYGVSVEKGLPDLFTVLGIEKEDYAEIARQVRTMKSLEI